MRWRVSSVVAALNRPKALSPAFIGVIDPNSAIVRPS